jgi:hypothetical protein
MPPSESLEAERGQFPGVVLAQHLARDERAGVM